MAHTRAQLAAQQGRVSPTSKPQGYEPGRVTKRTSPRRTRHHLQGQVASRQQQSSPTKEAPPQQHRTTPYRRGTKRPADALENDTSRKRQQQNPANSRAENSGGLDPVEYWAREGHWPKGYFKFDMEHMLARKKSLSSLGRSRSDSASSMTPSDQKPREEKSAPYKDTRYELLLQTKGTHLDVSDLGLTDVSKRLVQDLLNGKQSIPKETIFDEGVFVDSCRNLRSKNEARVIQDISRLIVPSAETLALRAKELKRLTESVNEGWNNSVPLTATRPQPDYSVGFKREAFTDHQLARLSPFVGDFITGDQSYFMATYYMYFPFLTCEVKCGAAALDVADRQNAHSMTLAVRATVELFRAVKREDEVNRQILAFSVSHDHRTVRIYGHYAVIDTKDTKHYRHPIRTFDFTELDGKDKWTAYRFTRNVYDIWMPMHFQRICSAIDQLPSEPNFDVPSQPEMGLPEDRESLMQPDIPSASLPVDQDGQSSKDKQRQVATPDTSFTGPQVAKKRKRTKKGVQDR